MHPPSIGVLIPFNLFQALCNNNNDFPTEDDNFWPKYLGMQYAPNIPLPFYKRILGKLIFLIGKQLSKKMIITYKK